MTLLAPTSAHRYPGDAPHSHASSEVRAPGVTSPGVTSPEVTSAKVTSLDVTSVEVTSSDGEQQRQTGPSGSSEKKSDAKLFLPFVTSTTTTSFNVQTVTSTIPFTCFNCE